MKTALVVTSISPPNPVLQALARLSQARDYHFIVIGDRKSPEQFELPGCEFYSLAQQQKTGFKLAELCPVGHYARKNIGYLIALQNRAEVILETDDDNFPYDSFGQSLQRQQTVPTVTDSGWLNVYQYYTEARIWPRGFPLDLLHQTLLDWESIPVTTVDCPIQQGLADDNPDVDAIYRLTLPLPQQFRRDRRLALKKGTWCPFNSQNTAWWRDVFPLMYLPAYCSFRMTDIWRSFVAQRLLWTTDWGLLFHEPTVYQERNVHDLMRDFEQEIVGYLHNRKIGDALAQLDLKSGQENLADNLYCCYEKLVSLEYFPAEELNLVQAWLQDGERFV
ncbi:MAG: STELLO glycosyltransferase family protein [Jaaginema sp. PMC 1079.18]|nr:STELLO glycosyltransferase family protein [Jaaginema sp. PMC 1080.18]MEC4854038.1 STELLO glycosyltransferase family protein [Jaaginema sp. PMC 1079.18]MEC4869057.1 STELLO glycosyltransferase family protein [Jaaginema sp. PMC 1078.18]